MTTYVPLAYKNDPDAVTCGICNLTWDNAFSSSVTPAPSALCPFCHGGAEPCIVEIPAEHVEENQ